MSSNELLGACNRSHVSNSLVFKLCADTLRNNHTKLNLNPFSSFRGEDFLNSLQNKLITPARDEGFPQKFHHR